MRQIKKGSVDRSVDIYIIDDANGTPETGVAFDTTGIDLKYRRDLSAAVSITEATLAALTTAHTDGGFKEIGFGVYRLDLPDAAWATGADHVTIFGTVTGMIVLPVTVQLVDFDPEDGASLGLDLATTAEITDAVMDDTIEGSITGGAGLTNDSGTQLTAITHKQAIALILAGVNGVLSGAAGTTVTIKQAGKPAGNSRIVATVDSSGNRSALTLKVPD